MRTSIALCALMTLSATVALAAPDITRQDIHLDITGATLTVTLDATVSNNAETAPLYARPRPEVSSQGGFDVHGFAPDNTRGRELMQTAVDLGSQLIPTYSEMYGAFPGNRVNLMTMPRSFFAGGLGLMGNVLLGEYVVGDLDYLLVQGTAHELAHTWWGGLASADPSSPHGGFMQEAMAEYSAWNALGRLKGDDTRTAGVRMNAVWYMKRRPRTPDLAVLDPNIQNSQLYVFVTYHKGSVVLRTLETMLGEAAFLRVLRSLQALGAGGLTPDAFINAVTTEGGAKARAAAEAWLGTPGWPTIQVSLERVPTDAGERVTATIHRTGDFPFTLPVHFVTEGGHRSVEMVEVTQESTVVTREFTQPLVAVEVDPTWSTLRVVEPLTAGDVNMDGFVDAADLMEVCLRHGTAMPTTRRQDGSYDPLYDVNADLKVDQADADDVYAAATTP